MALNHKNDAALKQILAAGYRVKSREQAKKDGDLKYIPGSKPHVCGHVALRNTSTGACTTCGSGGDVSPAILRKYPKMELYRNVQDAHGLMAKAIPMLKVIGTDKAKLLAADMEIEILKKGLK